MSGKIKMGFEPEGIVLPLDRIHPLRSLSPAITSHVKYKRIKASMQEIGIIEPLIVSPQSTKRNKKTHYSILDGHIRYAILKSLGETETLCLVSTDDEGYTYNHQVNKVATIQETVMFIKALDKGVSEDRLSKTLDVDMSKIRKKRNLLKGICAEAVELLKDKYISEKALKHFKWIKPLRQIEMAELMVSSNNYTASYAKAIYLATPKEMLADENKPKEVEGISPEDIARIEREMEALEQEFTMVQDEYSESMLDLTVAKGYLEKLLNNARVVRFMSQNYPEILSEFQKVCDAVSLEG